MSWGEFFEKTMYHRKVMGDFTIQELEDTLNQRILLITDDGFYIIDDGEIECKLESDEQIIAYINEGVGLVNLERTQRKNWHFMNKWDSPMIKIKIKIQDTKQKSKVKRFLSKLGILLNEV